MFERIVKKRNEKTNVFLCCVQSAYIGYVGFGWKNLESYVEMVAGLPRIQINDQELLRLINRVS
jgi:hypothetical protein